MMDFYRIAYPRDGSPVGKGPYSWDGPQGSWQGGISAARGIDLERHPVPTEDGISPGMSAFEYCGFQSERQMAEWFGGWGQELQAAGYRVYRYRVTGRRDGYRQSVAEIKNVEPMSISLIGFK